ncbi:MAG: DUF6249 domain-containing protein [Gammaproteobacteria bacterium]|nr:DUF6249 domain-containing protein [Gammaproteobacteria bacterium]
METEILMDGNILVPLGFFIFISTIIWIIQNFRHRRNQEIQITLRAMIEKGHQLSPELLKSLGNNFTSSRAKDLKRGVILVSIGVAISIISLFIFIAESAITGSILFLINFFTVFIVLGLTYIGFWKFMASSDRDTNQEISL